MTPRPSFPAARPADTTEAADVVEGYILAIASFDAPTRRDALAALDLLAAAARRTEQAEKGWHEAEQELADEESRSEAALARVRDLEQTLREIDAQAVKAFGLGSSYSRIARAALVSGAAEGNSDE